MKISYAEFEAKYNGNSFMDEIMKIWLGGGIHCWALPHIQPWARIMYKGSKHGAVVRPEKWPVKLDGHIYVESSEDDLNPLRW
jgi:hypothetical protein